MRAAVYRGEQVLQVEQLPDPVPGPGEVVMKVRYSAICGTDVHAFMYDLAQPGAVMGHEYTGAIVDVGPGVTRWQVGDRAVGGGGHPPPGGASATRTHPRFNYRTMGFQQNARPRGYAEYVLLNEWEPTPVPDDVTDEQAALCEPCAVTVHAVRLSDLRLGDAVLVLGAGPIGLLCLQTARAAGATTVIVSEPAPARAAAAQRLGADAVLDPATPDFAERVVELTAGAGPRIVFRVRCRPRHSGAVPGPVRPRRPGRYDRHRLGADPGDAAQLDGPRSSDAVILRHAARRLADCPGPDALRSGIRGAYAVRHQLRPSGEHSGGL